MRIVLATGAPLQRTVDLLVLPTLAATLERDTAAIDSALGGSLTRLIAHSGYTPSDGKALSVQTHGATRPRLILLVGVDTATSPTTWHRLADVAIQHARETRSRTLAVAFTHDLATAEALAATAEGAFLSAYRFDRFKSQPPPTHVPARIELLVKRRTTAAEAAVVRAEQFAAATCCARDLVMTPAADMTPAHLAREAIRIARRQRLAVRIHHERALAKLGMGAILGVAHGSAQAPCLIELTYRPRRRPTTCVAIVGKGITFDSGGLSLKHPDSMRGQKRDMAGGAAVLGVMSVIRRLAPPIEIRAYVPAAENMPDGSAIKPGDVVRAYNGKTIEVLNTDAEGRLVLADALAYAAKAKPDVIIDLATLTAAVGTALGRRYAGVLGSDAELIQALIAAGRLVGENLWELPLVKEYRSDLDSSVADLKNTGEGHAGTIIGALFLREFVGSTPWAHIDFSSTVLTEKPFPAHPSGATGFGVRTLLQYVTSL